MLVNTGFPIKSFPAVDTRIFFSHVGLESWSIRPSASYARLACIRNPDDCRRFTIQYMTRILHGFVTVPENIHVDEGES